MNKGLSVRIKELRQKGYSYNKIAKELNCAKSTVAYWCSESVYNKYKQYNKINALKKKEEKDKSKNYIKKVIYRYKRLKGCNKCGYNKNPYVLHFDHITDNKLLGISQMVQNCFSLKTIKKEIEKCQILCANCHGEKTSKNYPEY